MEATQSEHSVVLNVLFTTWGEVKLLYFTSQLHASQWVGVYMHTTPHSQRHTSSSESSWSSWKLCVLSRTIEILPVRVWQDTSPLYSIRGLWPNGSLVTPAITHPGPEKHNVGQLTVITLAANYVASDILWRV